MLIAVSGAQGVGKTTVLNELSMLDYSVDNFKVARHVQKQMGYDALSEAISTFGAMKEFQETIINSKFQHDFKLRTKNYDDKVFVERSFFDILIYAELWSEQLNTRTNNYWIDGFRSMCLKNQLIYDKLVIIEPNEKVNKEEDKNRASYDTQEQFNDRLIELCSYGDIPFIRIKEHDIKKRVDEIINFVEK